MLISTKGRYALHVMIDLAEQGGETYITLKDIATRQDISEKYLESILALLSKAGLVDGLRGKGGGYRLNRPPEDYSTAEILRIAEGSIVPVSCLDCSTAHCLRASDCKTLPMWKGLEQVINTYLEGYTLAELVNSEK